MRISFNLKTPVTEGLIGVLSLCSFRLFNGADVQRCPSSGCKCGASELYRPEKPLSPAFYEG